MHGTQRPGHHVDDAQHRARRDGDARQVAQVVAVGGDVAVVVEGDGELVGGVAEGELRAVGESLEGWCLGDLGGFEYRASSLVVSGYVPVYGANVFVLRHCGDVKFGKGKKLLI